MSITIRTTASSLSFALRNGENDTDIVYEPYPLKAGMAIAANLRQAFMQSPLLAIGHRRAVVLADTPPMLIPTEEFDERTAARLYRYVNTAHQGDDVMFRPVPGLNAVAAFAVNRDLQTVLRDHYTDIDYMPLMLPVWQHFFGMSHDSLHRRLFCYMHDGKTDLTAFRRDRFSFSTSFGVTLAEDAVYFVLNAWKQLGMQQETDNLIVAGTMPGKDRMLAELGKFITHISDKGDSLDTAADAKRDEVAMPLDLQLLYKQMQ